MEKNAHFVDGMQKQAWWPIVTAVAPWVLRAGTWAAKRYLPKLIRSVATGAAKKSVTNAASKLSGNAARKAISNEARGIMGKWNGRVNKVADKVNPWLTTTGTSGVSYLAGNAVGAHNLKEGLEAAAPQVAQNAINTAKPVVAQAAQNALSNIPWYGYAAAALSPSAIGHGVHDAIMNSNWGQSGNTAFASRGIGSGQAGSKM